MTQPNPARSKLSYDKPAASDRPRGDAPYSSTGASYWVCRGWTQHYAPDDAPHQWMHAYYEVAAGKRCGICHAAQDEERRWDGESNPFVTPEEAALYGWI